MAKAGKTVATLLVGAAIGAAVGYILATDDKKRKEDFDKLKDQVNDWTEKLKNKAANFRRTAEDIEADMYNS